MSIEYMDNKSANSIQSAKDEFVSYVMWLEEVLETAEKLGKEGNPALFLELEKLDGAESELAYYAARAHESVPTKNYAHSAERLRITYLPRIIATSISILQKDIAAGLASDTARARADELENLIIFYDQKYPALGLRDIGP